MDSIEIIEFKRPDEPDKNLNITGISEKLAEQEVHEKLYKIFSSYGALFDVYVGGGSSETDSASTNEGAISNHPGGSNYYAFVKLYSSQAALKAMIEVSGKYMLNGQLLKVKYSKSKKQLDGDVNLGFNKCCELANHYLGFNGWSSKILSIQEDKEDVAPNTVRFIGQVVIEVRGHSVQSEGVGLGEFTYIDKDAVSRMTAIHRAKKQAYMRACARAFGKLLLVVLPNGKVAVEVDCTQINKLDFATDEELQGVIEVNQVEPPGDENTNLVDDSVKDLDNLDEINEQVLLDLQAGIE